MNDGDWICGDANCGNINFARRLSCYRCNKERPDGVKPKKKLGTEIGKSAAEKSRGLFNADDWQCSKCANVNWARRVTCNVCNAPKFGEVEARTGYGGGYNERGVVEYRRREPSSDDEYDEFGRKKRKRKSDSQRPDEKVGSTEGPVFKMLPPTVLQKGAISNRPASKNKEQEKISGSLSDGSVCDLPPVTKKGFRRNQVQNQANYYRPEHLLPSYRYQYRKRYSSTGEREHTGSSGYETAPKKYKRDSSGSPVTKLCNPVMENRVSSTNNDVTYKFTGSTPALDFQVTYTLEERVKAAAFAVVYCNCKITTEKFEAMFDKPAPDFKTIFAWRQRLLGTGCLVDGHVSANKDVPTKTAPPAIPAKTEPNDQQRVKKISNPEEIIISSSDSDDDNINVKLPSQPVSRRSASIETLHLATDRAAGSSVSTADERESQARSRDSRRSRRSHSRSTQNNRTRSPSSDSDDSNYPSDDSVKKPATPVKVNKSLPSRKISRSSGSDSATSDSEEDDFRERVFKGNKLKRKIKKRAAAVTPVKAPNYQAPVVQAFPGYSTSAQLGQSPLATGNIYTPNLRNMNVKVKENVMDTDGCSSEYIPTKLGSNAKRNYQAFKDNVKKKGFWVKANGQSFSNNNKKPNVSMNAPVRTRSTSGSGGFWVQTHAQVNKFSSSSNVFNNPVSNDTGATDFWSKMSSQSAKDVNISNDLFSNIAKTSSKNTEWSKNEQSSATEKMSISPVFSPVEDLDNENQSNECYETSYNTVKTVSTNDEIVFVNDDISNFEPIDPYKSPITQATQIKQTIQITETPEDTSSVFDMVQSNNSTKNKSILDIFGNENTRDSPEKDTTLEKYDSVRKTYETEWDDDDEALYGGSETTNTPSKEPGSIHEVLNKPQSPVSIGLYGNDESTAQTSTPNKITMDVLRERRDILLDVLKDFQVNRDKEIESIKSQEQPSLPIQIPLHEIPFPKPVIETQERPSEVSKGNVDTDITKDHEKIISPSKKVRILESITIKPMDITSQNIDERDENTTPNEHNDDLNTSENPVVNIDTDSEEMNKVSESTPAAVPQIDLSQLLANINTNTLLLALQNLQQQQQSSTNNAQENDKQIAENETEPQVETINLTNDEDWEKESVHEGSIERQLKRLDGNTGDTPFLNDIFDPEPIRIPPNVAKKLNINLDDKPETQVADENAPIIGNFKSFALPKPIMLNRLKVTVKVPDKPKKFGKKSKKKSKPGASKEGSGGEEDEEEESGDEADLSKYDLCGSDEEGGTSKADAEKDGETSKEDSNDKNGKTSSPDAKRNKRRSSSSSSTSSSSSSSSSSSQGQSPKNRFDDFNLNSEREGSPRGRDRRSRSRSSRSRSGKSPQRRKSHDSRSSRDKERSRDRDRRDERSRSERKERRYSRDGNNHSRPRRRLS